jgi:predicted transcriptional regulator
MKTGKINDRKLLRLIDEGMSQAKAAKTFGVSRQAVHQRLIELRGRNTKIVVAKKMEEAVDRRLDSIGQLHEINRKTLELLDQAEQDPNLALKCISEIRSQLRLSLEIFETMYSLQHVEQFVEIVKSVIREVDPDVYQKIIRRLNDERALRTALRFA